VLDKYQTGITGPIKSDAILQRYLKTRHVIC
jgi:hypothetical protein